MPDKNGYPTKEELEFIRKWKYGQGQSVQDLIHHLEDIWWKSDWGFKLKNGRNTGKKIKRLFLSTGGWSGNEIIIDCLTKTDFWTLFWEQSKRGGHYIFKIPLEEF